MRGNITPELEQIEREIDFHYLTNPLTKLGFGEAVWYFLAACEETTFKHVVIDQLRGHHDLSAAIDSTINDMKVPITWLRATCKPGYRNFPPNLSDLYTASMDLLELAREYGNFEAGYTYASMGVVTIEIRGKTLVPTIPFRDDTRYEAYDRMLVVVAPLDEDEQASDFFTRVKDSVSVDGDRFQYALNPAIVRDGLKAVAPILNQQFKLPPSWQLPRYSFGDFQSVFSVLRVIGMIHFVARCEAARRGCIGMGYRDSIRIMDHEELLNRLHRYTKIKYAKLESIVEDSTYGSRGIRSPDPALQPLVRVRSA